MKKIFQYISIIILFSFLGIILRNQDSFRLAFQQITQALHITAKPCEKPLAYSFGNIDHRFSLSQGDLQKVSEQAGGIWDEAAGKKLFQYDPKSDFKINFIYDDRQAQSQASDKLDSQLKGLNDEHEAVVNDYNSLSDGLKKRLDAYNASVKDYKNKLDSYNQEVSFWNAKGGAPDDEFRKLKNEKEDLDKTFSGLEKERVAINNLVGKTNALVQKESTIVNSYNSSLSTYNQTYGSSREFDKGLYDGKEINIYQFHNLDDLRLALAHEMGHAIGLDHVENPKSIMYYLMGEQDINNPQLSAEDMAALKGVCQMN